MNILMVIILILDIFWQVVFFYGFLNTNIEVTQAQVQHDYNAVKEEALLESQTKPFLQVLCDLMSHCSCQPRSQDSV